MTFAQRQQINESFKARTLNRADYQKALRALRVAMQPQSRKTRRSIDDSALTLAIRLFGSADGKRIWAQQHAIKRQK